jgi:tetratricopeptide (TPR) repeat protein/predicted Ser/Thr protein kinase
MQPERWRQIEDIFHAALERQPALRPAFLADACRGDEALRLQVEELLRQDAGNGELLSEPIAKVAGEMLTASPVEVHFSPGSMAGPYLIGERLGAGGMGEVYRARDTRLPRTVAIKTLKASFTDRFQREARAISALNHPHICTLYDIGSQDGIGYLVMEYVEGEPLKGPLRIDEALRLAIQIVSALEAAHQQGILHRDLKPGNILVSKNGVKLLDFGLAKFVPTGPRPADVTVTAPLTETGQIVGTVAYMSPEQIEGKTFDARSDIFSFGLVLYEMLAGRRAFEASSQNGLMAAILKEEPPPLTAIQPPIPAALERTVRQCLEKDPARRWQTAADLRHELERIAEGEPAAPQRRFLTWTIAAAAAILLFCAAGYFYLHRTPKLTDKDTIVLADFKNTTGDPVFDGTLRQGLAVQLEQSPFLSLVSDERIRQALGLMSRPADARLTPELAKEICERTASAATLDGSIAGMGSQYVLGLRARNCRSGDVLDEEQVQAARKEDVLNALSQIARRFRTRAGESLALVQKYQTSLEEATTPSLEAWKAYSTGWQITLAGGTSAAVPFFQHAIEIDPGFAVAYASLGRAYGDSWEPVLSAESMTKAYALRNRASERERLFIILNYHGQVTGNIEQSREAAEVWAQTYPRDPQPVGFLSWIYQELGQFQKSAEEGNQAIQRDPDFVFGYNNLAWAYIFLNQPGKAEETLREASARKIYYPEFSIIRYSVAFLRGDQPAMDREAAGAAGKPGEEDWMFAQEAAALGYRGHLREARIKLRHAVDLDQQPAQHERAALYQAGGAVREAFFGNTNEARQDAAAARKLSDGRDVKYGAALALALSGDTAAAQTIAKELAERFPDDTLVKFVYLPALAALAAFRHEPAKGIELLRAATPYDLAAQGGGSGCFGNLYTAYVRGLAYNALHQGAAAAAEFQKVLDNPGMVASDPVGAMAQLELGRTFQLAGDKAKAKLAYEKFLTLWKDADSGIPILIQAKAEYARLR